MRAHEFGTDLLLEAGDAARLLEDVFQYSGVCIKVLDLDGRVVRWSPACKGLYGWAAEEVVGRVLPHIPTDSRLGVIKSLRDIAESGEAAKFSGVALNCEGWRFNMRLTIVPIVDHDGNPMGVLTIACEPLLEDATDVLQERLSAFTGRTIREPLAAIANAARLLARPEVANDPERRTQLIATIAALANETGDLVDDLSVTPNAAACDVVEDQERVDVGSLLAEVAALGVLAQRVLVDFEPGATSAAVNRTRIARAFAIMLRVAVVSADPGSMVFASAWRDGSGVSVDISFTGTHPKGEALARAFDAPLSDVDDGVAAPWTRLHLVRGAVEVHGGETSIAVDSERGVTFTVTLPEDRARTGRPEEET